MDVISWFEGCFHSLCTEDDTDSSTACYGNGTSSSNNISISNNTADEWGMKTVRLFLSNREEKEEDSNDYCCCPTICLTTRFFQYLSKQQQQQRQHSLSPPAALLILNAYVYSMQYYHHHHHHTVDWMFSLSYFPALLRTVLELAVDQIRSDSSILNINPLNDDDDDVDKDGYLRNNIVWPDYLLRLVGRVDLCGKKKERISYICSLQ